MSIAPRQIGPYEIHREIGRGGMGVVYLAHDSRLGRQVAIKALPADLAEDPARLARFEREARMLASLNHTNIAGIHGLEEVDGVRYLVLEYIDGEDLSVRLVGGGLPVDEALHIGKQIAGAVEAAHAKAIIHRDLKPANVMVTTDGDVKVLDFGLAKAVSDEEPPSAAHDSPTRVQADSPTVAGVVLGTAGYMSPEQARGKAIDKRSDIWSFGCILYEMLAGTGPFPGETVTESLGATIHKEPDWTPLPPETPVGVHLLLHRCLQKDKSRRLQDIGDARVELDEILSGAAEAWSSTIAAAPTARSSSHTWIILTLLPLVAAAGFALSYLGRTETPSAPLIRASVPAPENTVFVPSGELAGSVVVSPDERMLAFVAIGEDDLRRLWVRPLEAASARVLAGTEGATFPFWSGDSRSIAFFVDDELKRVDLAGGNPITICTAPTSRGGTWNRDGVILLAPEFQSPICRVPATGGTPTPVTTIDWTRHTSHRWPSFLPDGRHFLYSAIQTEATEHPENAIFMGSLDDGTTHEVMRLSSNARYSSGHLLFVRQGILMALPFDDATGRTHGKPVPVASGAAHSLSTWRAAFFASSSIVAYHTGDLVEGEGARITWYDRNGKQLQTIDQVTAKATLRQSFDGASLAFSARQDVWVFDRERQMPTRVTFLPGFEGRPVWSPDGSELAFYYTLRSSGDTPMGIYRQAVDSGTPQLVLAEQGLDLQPEDWSPDGKYLLFSRTDREGNSDLLALPLDPPGEPLTIAATPFNEVGCRISPDGHWIAYHSDESGEDEVYVESFDPSTASAGLQRKWRISNAGGYTPVWSRDGSELYYLTEQDTLMAVDIDADGTRFRPGTPKALFRINLGPGNTYDVGADGSFVVTLPNDQSTRPIELILNWTSALR